MGAAEPGTYYGMYHVQTQVPGRGDGSDGQLDNRTLLATPGKPHTKSALVSQDMSCVSVRGLALNNWLRDVAAGTAAPPGPQNVRLPFGPSRRRS